MKHIFSIALTLVSAMWLGSCDRPKTSTSSDTEQPQKRESNAIPAQDASHEDQRRRIETDDANNWAMNKNTEMRAFYSQPPPPWLRIGKPVSSHIGGETGSIQWTRKTGAEMKQHFGDKQRVAAIASGTVKLPISLSDRALSYTIVNNNRSRAVIAKSGYHLSADVYKIKDGLVIEDSAQEIPVINFDDDRRWHITWQTWFSESTLVGVMEEEDLNEEGPTRVALYLYETEKRELRRVEIPETIKPAPGEGIAIVAASSNALLITIGIHAKEHLLSLER